MITKVAVVSIWVGDIPATAHFYRDVLGLQLMPHHGSQLHFDINGIYLTILQGEPAQPPSLPPVRFPLVAFATEDLDAAVERLERHKVKMPWGIEQDQGSRWVMFFDPAGNLIEIVQMDERK